MQHGGSHLQSSHSRPMQQEANQMGRGTGAAATPNLRIPTLEPMWWKGRTLTPYTHTLEHECTETDTKKM